MCNISVIPSRLRYYSSHESNSSNTIFFGPDKKDGADTKNQAPCLSYYIKNICQFLPAFYNIYYFFK